MQEKRSENRGRGQRPGNTRPGRDQRGRRPSPSGKPSREIERESMSEVDSDELFERDFDVDLDEEDEITQRNPRVGVDHEHGNLDPDRE